MRRSALVGREGVLESLADVASRGSRGHACAVLLGSAGTGKTAVLKELEGMLGDTGYHVLVAPAGEDLPRLPFSSLLSALSTWLEDPPVPALVPAIARLRRIAAQAAASPEKWGLRVTHEVAGLLDTASADRPTALLFDDFHRVDAASLGVLPILVRRLAAAGSRGVVVLACRSDRVTLAVVGDVFAELAEVSSLSRLDLMPLAEGAVEELVARRVGARPAVPLITALRAGLERDAGNPGAVLGALAALQQEGAISVVDGHAYLREEATVTLHPDSVLLQRLAELAPVARMVAQCLAVLRNVTLAEVPLVAEACGLPVDAVEAELDRLAAADVLDLSSGGPIGFEVPAMAASLARQVSTLDRQRWHASAARYLLRRQATGRVVDEESLADHIDESGGMIASSDSVDLLVRAAQGAEEDDPLRALRWLRRAAQLLPAGSTRRQQLLVRLVPLLCSVGRWHEAVEEAEQVFGQLASSAGQPCLIVEVCQAWVQALLQLGRLHEVRPVLARAERLVGRADSRLLSEQVRTELVLGDLRRAQQLAASTPGAGVPDDVTLVLLHAVEGDAGACAAAVARHLASHPERAGLIDMDEIHEAATMGDLVGAGQVLTGKVPARLSSSELTRYARVRADFDAGHWHEVLSYVRELEALSGGESAGYARGMMRALAAEICCRMGSDTQARDWAGKVAEPVSPFGYVTAWARCGVLHAAGERQAAYRQAAEALERYAALGYDGGLDLLLGRLIELAVRDRMTADAERWLGELSEFAARVPTRRVVMTLRYCQALVHDDFSAAQEVVSVAKKQGNPFDVARACLAVGRLAPEPAEVLREAHEGFRSLEAARWRTQTAATMRARGVPVPRVRADRSALSSTEHQIIEMLAAGATNRQIASAMQLREKTVEGYLTRLFAKTGYRSRVELATAYVTGRLGRELTRPRR